MDAPLLLEPDSTSQLEPSAQAHGSSLDGARPKHRRVQSFDEDGKSNGGISR